VEPEIGHLQTNGFLRWNFLLGPKGNAIHAVLGGAGHNLWKILTTIRFLCLDLWRPGAGKRLFRPLREAKQDLQRSGLCSCLKPLEKSRRHHRANWVAPLGVFGSRRDDGLPDGTCRQSVIPLSAGCAQAFRQ
jgi:hypothetical protein